VWLRFRVTRSGAGTIGGKTWPGSIYLVRYNIITTTGIVGDLCTLPVPVVASAKTVRIAGQSMQGKNRRS
jgi:hypothetical protein